MESLCPFCPLWTGLGLSIHKPLMSWQMVTTAILAAKTRLKALAGKAAKRDSASTRTCLWTTQASWRITWKERKSLIGCMFSVREQCPEFITIDLPGEWRHILKLLHCYIYIILHSFLWHSYLEYFVLKAYVTLCSNLLLILFNSK